MQKAIRFWANILVILVLITGTRGVVKVCNKIVDVSAKLISINQGISWYNESETKTNKMTEEYQLLSSKRAAIYNSEDKLIRDFSNMNSTFKGAIFLMALLVYPSLAFGWGVLIMRAYSIISYKTKYQRKIAKRFLKRLARSAVRSIQKANRTRKLKVISFKANSNRVA